MIRAVTTEALDTADMKVTGEETDAAAHLCFQGHHSADVIC